MIHYEYPFNERLRTLLRLEDLFDRFGFFAAQANPHQHHVAITTLFEIVDIAGRADLKSDLLKELDRQRSTLSVLSGNHNVDQAALKQFLEAIEQAHQALNAMQGKTGQYIAENEWLTGIRSRSIIPGGTCEFDLPSYYAWQHLPAEQRQQDIQKWMQPLYPLRDGTRIVLRLLRESGSTSKVMAISASYQQMLSGRAYQLMQVHVDDISIIPEISANKYMVWVRFTKQDGEGKPKPLDIDVPFQLTLCNL